MPQPRNRCSERVTARVSLTLSQVQRIANALTRAGDDDLAVQFYCLASKLAQKEAEERAARLEAIEEINGKIEAVNTFFRGIFR